MHGEGFFFQAFIYLIAAVIAVPIAKRLGLGSVLGYLLAGVAIGPFVLGLVGEEGQDIMHFAEFGVVMMLFLVGLELQPSLLWRMRTPIVGLGGLQVVLTTAVIAGIAIAVGLSWQMALALGMIVAMSSTAIVLQTLNEKGLMKTDAGQNAFAVLLFQDLAVIPILAILPLLAVAPIIAGDADQAPPAHTDASAHDHAHDLNASPTLERAAAAEAAGNGEHAGSAGDVEHASSTWIDGMSPWAQALIVLGSILGIIAAGRFVVRPLFRMIARTRLRELFTAASLLLVIGIALLMTKIGMSPALGTFLAGVVLATSEYRHELEADIEPFKGLLLGLFFISVGASIDFGIIQQQPATIAALVGGLIVVKFGVLAMLGRVFKLKLDQNLLFSFSLAQTGEFAFVLLSFAQQNHVMTPAVAGPMVVVVAISMALTPLLMVLNERLIQPRVGTRQAAGRDADDMSGHEDAAVIVAGFGRFGSVVGRFLRANNVATTVLDHDSDNVDVLRRLGLQVFYGDATRPEMLHLAGADKAKLVVLALDDAERNLHLAHTVRHEFPHVKLLARAINYSNAHDLFEAGVEHVYLETFESSLRLGVDALSLLDKRANHATRALRLFRKHETSALRELAHERTDRRTYFNRARQRIEDLERSLKQELTAHDTELESAWDPTTLRDEFSKMLAPPINPSPPETKSADAT